MMQPCLLLRDPSRPRGSGSDGWGRDRGHCGRRAGSVTIGAGRDRGVGPILQGYRYPRNGVLMQAFEATNYYFDRAAQLLDLSENIRTLLMTPDREVRVEVPIELDSGKIGNFIGY